MNARSSAELTSSVMPAERGRRFPTELVVAVRAARGRSRTAAVYLTADKRR